MPADRYPKRTWRGPWSERATYARSEKQGMKMAATHNLFLHQAPGRYLGMKPNGQLLLDRVNHDFPAGNTDLTHAPSNGRLHAFTMGLTNGLKITNVPVLDRYVNIILPPERSEIQKIVKSIFAGGVRFSSSSTSRDNRSSTCSVHLGIWEKFSREPRITGETWALQNASVRSLILQLLTLISTKVAPRMNGILRAQFPTVWRRQERIRARVLHLLKDKLADKPWLDFGGAFFAVAVKIGSSEIDHLDWTDDIRGLTWVAGVGDWEGADLRLVETGYQFPVEPGSALAGNMRLMVHSASPITRGERITLTFFTCSLLASHALGEDY